MGQLQAALSSLHECLELSASIGDTRDNADMYGSMADLFADMGQLEEAAKVTLRYLLPHDVDQCLHDQILCWLHQSDMGLHISGSLAFMPRNESA